MQFRVKFALPRYSGSKLHSTSAKYFGTTFTLKFEKWILQNKIIYVPKLHEDKRKAFVDTNASYFLSKKMWRNVEVGSRSFKRITTKLIPLIENNVLLLLNRIFVSLKRDGSELSYWHNDFFRKQDFVLFLKSIF